ncbi:MAG: response regulator [Anaerolineae bacterium]|nr:response regulator [Anaerolineae bacterium]
MTGERVLLVESSNDARRFLMQNVLEPAGYDVLCAAGGSEGITLARDLEPDLVITAHQLDDQDGLAVLAALSELDVVPPVILMVANGSEALAIEALRLGAADYLPKPVSAEELLNSAQRVLSQYWTQQITQHVPDQLFEANRQLEQRVYNLDTLVQVGKRVTSLLDLQPVLDQVIRAAVELTHAEHGTLLLLDKTSGELFLYAATGEDDLTPEQFRLPVSDSLAGQVVQTGQPLVISGDELLKIKTHYFARSLAYIPLVIHEQVIGVLGVTNQHTSQEFDAYTLQLVRVLADFAAVAIENARLYTASEHERSTFDTILRDTEEPIIVIDTAGAILFCNPAACRIFDIPIDNYQGIPLADVVHHQDVLDLFENPVRSGHSRVSEIVLNDGRRILNAQLTEVDDFGKIAVMQDITHLKELDRVKSEFVTSVSHDLRSPLTAILGYVEMLNRMGPLNDQQRKFIERIIFSVQSITALITDLLELGKIEADFDQNVEPTYLNLIVRYAVEGLRHEWEAKHHQLDANLPDNPPPVLGNPLRLRQLVNNLLENAIKYTPENGWIGISLEAESEFLVLRVSDTGIGIPQQDQPYIFDKFYRSDEAIDQYTGTGLGLSIVKGIVDQHKGRIWVESHEGEGSSFIVMLPGAGLKPKP